MTDQEKSILEFNFSKMPEEDLNALLKQTALFKMDHAI